MKRSGVKDEEACGFRIPRKERNHVAGNPLNTFTQDFNTNFLRTSNSGTARSELVSVSQVNSADRRIQIHPPKSRRVLNREMSRICPTFRSEF